MATEISKVLLDIGVKDNRTITKTLEAALDGCGSNGLPVPAFLENSVFLRYWTSGTPNILYNVDRNDSNPWATPRLTQTAENRDRN